NRRAERSAFEGARKNLDRVALFARRDDLRLSRPATVEVRLNVAFRQFQSRRAAVDHDADTAPVRLAPGGDAEQMSESVRHALRVPENGGPVKFTSAFKPGGVCAPGPALPRWYNLIR